MKVSGYITPTTEETAVLYGLKPMKFGEPYLRQEYKIKKLEINIQGGAFKMAEE